VTVTSWRSLKSAASTIDTSAARPERAARWFDAPGELREHLSAKFRLTSPEAFAHDIEDHRRHIAPSSACLGPGARETHLDFRFHPAIDDATLTELRVHSSALQARIAARTRDRRIDCLLLFLSDVQLRIYFTLLMGEHDETGRAFAAYAAVMQSAIDYYSQSGAIVGALPENSRDRHLDILADHRDMGYHIGLRMLPYGKADEFGDYTAIAERELASTFDATRAAVDAFFGNLTARS
jgi:hypothetical protein